MRVIAMFFGPCASRALTSDLSVLSYNFKRLERFTKLATSSSIASDEHRVWRSYSQEAKRGETSGHRITRHGEAMGSLFLPCAPPGCPYSREGARAVPRLGGSRGRLP